MPEDSEMPNSPNSLSADKVDVNKISKDTLALQVAGKQDTRNAISHTFVGTGEESFLHSLTYIPQGATIASQSKGAAISFNTRKWTNRRVYMTSTVAGNAATFIFY